MKGHMIFEEQEQIQSDASPESSSETQDQSDSNAQPEQSASEQVNKQTDTPFHEHPRFKELVEQKNQFASQAKQLQDQIAQLQSRMEASSKQSVAQKEQDALLSRLKGIDPEFGERFEKLDATRKELEEMRAWREEMENERVRTQAISTISSLHEQNKVSADHQELYKSLIAGHFSSNPQLGLKDLPNVYKNVHESISKMLEGVKRSERESYVKGKAVDAKTPTSQPKGKPVKGSGDPEYSKDPEVARKQMISRILKQSKADNSL